MFRRRIALLLAIILFILLAPGTGVAMPFILKKIAVTQTKNQVIIASVDEKTPNALLVRYKPGTISPLRSQAVLSPAERSLERLGFQRVKPLSGESLDAAMARLGSDNNVEFVEPDYLFHSLGVFPAGPWDNEPGFLSQWSLDIMGFPWAWTRTTGNVDLVVAVVDTGILSQLSQFSGRVLPGQNMIDTSSSAEDDATDLHGTAMAGVIAAALDGQGLVGVSPSVGLLPVKVLRANGSGEVSYIAAGIIWAADQGARVINISLGGADDSTVLQKAVQYAMDKGAVVVAASGNHQEGAPTAVIYPAAYPGVLAVGASDSYDQVAAFSNYGPQVSSPLGYEPWIDLVAPGKGIAVMTHEGQITVGSGTSYAAAHVSGLAALLLSYRPGLKSSEVASIMTKTAVDIAPAGWDEKAGNGRIHAAAAFERGISMVTGDVNGNGIVDIYDMIIVSRAMNQATNFNPGADLDQNGRIDLLDLMLVARNYSRNLRNKAVSS